MRTFGPSSVLLEVGLSRRDIVRVEPVVVHSKLVVLRHCILTRIVADIVRMFNEKENDLSKGTFNERGPQKRSLRSVCQRNVINNREANWRQQGTSAKNIKRRFHACTSILFVR